MTDPLTAIGLVKRYWKPAAVLILLMLLSTCCYQKGAEHERNKWQVKLSAMKEQLAYNQAQAEAKARKQEADWSAAFDVISTIQQESLADAISRRDRIIAGLRAGRLSFRPCSGVPEAPAHPGEPEAAPDAGQSGMVGEAITARLAVCDEVTLERNQAVRLLEAERQ